jgi:hypothetical protein
MAAQGATIERGSVEKMLPAARAAKAVSINTSAKERCEPASTNPSAKVLWNIAICTAQERNQCDNTRKERQSDETGNKSPPAKVGPCPFVFFTGEHSRKPCA